jgi:hypothetical protein
MANKPAPKADDTYSDEETARRRDATIRAMIAMPPKPHQPKTQPASVRRKGKTKR